MVWLVRRVGFKSFEVPAFGCSTGLYTHKSGRVVITGSLGITIGFQYWVGLHDLVLQGAPLWVCTSRGFVGSGGDWFGFGWIVWMNGRMTVSFRKKEKERRRKIG